jgi:hypothetical protein
MQNTLIFHIKKFISLEPSDIDKLESCLEVSKIKKKRTYTSRRANMQYNVFYCKRLYASVYH